MTDGIGFPIDKVPVIGLRGAFRPVAGAVDRDREQGSKQTRGGSLLGETQGCPDLGPRVAAQFVVAADDQVRVVMTDLDRDPDAAPPPRAAQPETDPNGSPLHAGKRSGSRLGNDLGGGNSTGETSGRNPKRNCKQERC